MNAKEKKWLRQEVMARGLPDPCLAYSRQKANAKKRGIGWELTFAEWWAIWRDYFHLRGQGKNCLVMGREGDQGPYAIGNVYLTTNMGNVSDYHQTERAVKRRQEIRERNYANRKQQRWGKAFCGGKSSGLAKAKNFFNGVETIEPQEDA
jgi:hypothetical protein